MALDHAINQIESNQTLAKCKLREETKPSELQFCFYSLDAKLSESYALDFAFRKVIENFAKTLEEDLGYGEVSKFAIRQERSVGRRVLT
eukprot:8731979-Pyramimonas_sp.AAC.1